ncbi:MAG: DUF4105 domain-containing protein [Sphingobacteriales bacterium]|nr:DUF4105 domain-containing protein [Sphingobacteriales bacterium]
MKHIIAKLLLFLSLLLCQQFSKAQDSSHIRISLLTCTPGDELYSTFGHSAIRITDSNSVQDIVFNYGTFNFDDEHFYLKFIRGKLLYSLSAERFDDFKALYQETNRGITEQVLNLSAEEKLNIYHALLENIKEENRYYKYDFFLDNCTTRLRDIIVKYKMPHPELKAVMPETTRFRQAIHQYLDKNNKDWSKFGIDILLGAPTDAVMTIPQQQFLPDNLMKALDASNKNSSLVSSETNLYPINVAEATKASFFSPNLIFYSLLIIIVVLSFSPSKSTQNFLVRFDGFFFFLTGLLGIILILMWTATDHAMCKNNYNLLWALPSHTIIAFVVNSQKSWVKKYFLFTAIVLGILLIAWFFLPQQLNNAFIPIVLLLIYRSVARYLNTADTLEQNI